jgi:hypothetical protein
MVIQKEQVTIKPTYPWERFLTAITRVIVAAPLEKQRDASRSHSHQPSITT